MDEKTTFRKWIENFWYHNKLAVILISLAVVFMVIVFAQIIFRVHPDAYVMYVGPRSISMTEIGNIKDGFDRILKDDYNKDGKKQVDYLEITLADGSLSNEAGTPITAQTNMQLSSTMYERYKAEILSGNSQIYLLSPEYFEALKADGILMPFISDEFLGEVPKNAYDAYGIKINELDIYKILGFDALPEDTILCMRYRITFKTSESKSLESNARHVQVFKDMLDYVYEKPVYE